MTSRTRPNRMFWTWQWRLRSIISYQLTTDSTSVVCRITSRRPASSTDFTARERRLGDRFGWAAGKTQFANDTDDLLLFIKCTLRSYTCEDGLILDIGR